ncbi:MAG: hypothetical protein KDC80_21655 [Saprospiraceae bacterium]|nr:hypothetical protein [Saprospiraceae bacterium]
MLRIIFSILLILHGLIHLLGSARAFDLYELPLLNRSISKPWGLLWLLVSLLFIITASLFMKRQSGWIQIGFASLILSQLLLVVNWQEAKYGTIINVIFTIILVLNFGQHQFKKKWTTDVLLHLNGAVSNTEILTNSDIQHLPAVVQKYLHYCQVIDKPKVRNFKVVMEGQMRNKQRDFFPFRSVQYNFLEGPSRLFFMEGKMLGLAVPGYHRYVDARASMKISLFGIIPIVNLSGDTLDRTETVTLLNDICLMAPGALIDERITWKTLNDSTVLATFFVDPHRVSAELHFDPQGKLINFVSYDRTEVGDMVRYPFHTPIHAYTKFDQFNLVSQGDGTWIYPEGAFTYGKFDLKSIAYNLQKIDRDADL